jgi:predicted MFS family arabinose efflux permease
VIEIETRRTSRRLAFPMVCLAALAEFIGVGILIPVLPRYVRQDLGLGDLAVGIAVGVFAVGALGVRPLAGRWGDVRGRRPLLVAGLVITAVPTAAMAAGGGYGAVLALRVVTGVGQALFFVGGATLAADLAAPGRRGAALSLFSLPIYAGLGVGPALGEQLYERYGAAPAFVVAGALPAVALLLAPVLPDHRPDPAPTGAARVKGPLLHPVAFGPGVVILLGLLGFIGFQAYLTLYSDQIGLARPELVFLLYSGIVVLVRTAGAGLPDRLGAARAGTYANIAIATGLGVVALVPHPAAVFAGTAVLSTGMALQYPALMSLAVGRAPEEERARVVSTFSGFFDLAQAGGGAVLGAAAAELGYRAAFGCGALSALLGLAILRLRVTREPTPAPAEPVGLEPAAYELPAVD